MLDFQKNYYEILQVAADAPLEELKRAYRQLARRYHPDLNPGDKIAEDLFKDVVEAYDTLSDAAQRALYDRQSPWGNRSKDSRRPPAPEGRNGRKRYRDGGAAEYATTSRRKRIPLDDEDLYRTSKTRTAYTVSEQGDWAETPVGEDFGDRARNRTGRTERAPRVGSGPRRDVEARLSIPLTKAYRGGRERIRLEDGRSLEVDMLPGMVEGQQLRLRDQGIGGGDLYLKISILPHPCFELRGADVFCRIPISPSEAVLGGQVEVPTLDGPVKMSLPPDSNTGKRLRLAEKGYWRGNGEGGRGDQLVELYIVVPPEPSSQERELYEKLQRLESFNPRMDLLENC